MGADIAGFLGPKVSVEPSPGLDVPVRHCKGCNCYGGYPSEEAMAAIAAACTCPGCMTGGRCVDDPPDEDTWGDMCSHCTHDCQICSETSNCDCPTHGGEG